MLHLQVTCIIIRVPSQVLQLVDCLNLIYICKRGSVIMYGVGGCE